MPRSRCSALLLSNHPMGSLGRLTTTDALFSTGQRFSLPIIIPHYRKPVSRATALSGKAGCGRTTCCPAPCQLTHRPRPFLRKTLQPVCCSSPNALHQVLTPSSVIGTRGGNGLTHVDEKLVVGMGHSLPLNTSLREVDSHSWSRVPRESGGRARWPSVAAGGGAGSSGRSGCPS